MRKKHDPHKRREEKRIPRGVSILFSFALSQTHGGLWYAFWCVYYNFYLCSTHNNDFFSRLSATNSRTRLWAMELNSVHVRLHGSKEIWRICVRERRRSITPFQMNEMGSEIGFGKKAVEWRLMTVRSPMGHKCFFFFFKNSLWPFIMLNYINWVSKCSAENVFIVSIINKTKSNRHTCERACSWQRNNCSICAALDMMVQSSPNKLAETWW